MGHDNKKKLKAYDFLLEDRVSQRFADINIDLLRGRHIEPSDYGHHDVLSDFYDEFKEYYESLYKLVLRREKKDGTNYFYLDFPEGGKGKMNSSSRYKELNEDQTIIGIMLLNMYYAKWFEHPKEIWWPDITQEIKQGELRQHYKLLLFGDIRDDYTEPEWERVEKKFKNTLSSFDHLGWVSRLSGSKEEIHFTINVSINRLGELYQEEIADIDKLAKRIQQRDTNEPTSDI